MKRSSRRSSVPASSGGEQGFWPSFADMMSAVALILFFLMLLAYIQNIITNNDLMHKEEQLTDTLEQLAIAAAQVQQKEAELKTVSDTLDTAKADLEAQQALLTQQQQHITEQEDSIAQQATFITQQQADIAAQQQTIAQQQAQMEQQKIYLNNTQAELSLVRAQLESAAGVRWNIVRQLSDSINQAMGANTVSVGDNGSLVLSDSVLFNSGKADLNADSRQVLDQVTNGLAAFLSNAENLKYVDTIVIGGHADSTGGEANNRRLSTDRANNVLSYLLEAQGGALAPYSKYFGASGYSSSRPVASNDTPEGRALNRRIEISIVLKDDTVMDALNQYLAIEIPTTAASG